MPIIQTIETEAGKFIIECDNDGWNPVYRMRHEDRVTDWGHYDDGLMIGDHIALSPYYTEFDEYILCTPFEACQYLCVQENK